MQHYALVVLDFAERLDRWKREEREVRLALVASGVPVQNAFPELFDKKDEEQDEDDLPADDEAVRYIFQDDTPLDPQSIEQELRELAAEAARGNSTFGATFSDWM